MIDGKRCDVKKALSREEIQRTQQKQRDVQMREQQHQQQQQRMPPARHNRCTLLVCC